MKPTHKGTMIFRLLCSNLQINCPICQKNLKGKFKQPKGQMAYIVWYCSLCKSLINLQINKFHEKNYQRQFKDLTKIDLN